MTGPFDFSNAPCTGLSDAAGVVVDDRAIQIQRAGEDPALERS
jgi:hypothetical protein